MASCLILPLGGIAFLGISWSVQVLLKLNCTTVSVQELLSLQSQLTSDQSAIMDALTPQPTTGRESGHYMLLQVRVAFAKVDTTFQMCFLNIYFLLNYCSLNLFVKLEVNDKNPVKTGITNYDEGFCNVIVKSTQYLV